MPRFASPSLLLLLSAFWRTLAELQFVMVTTIPDTAALVTSSVVSAVSGSLPPSLTARIVTVILPTLVRRGAVLVQDSPPSTE